MKNGWIIGEMDKSYDKFKQKWHNNLPLGDIQKLRWQKEVGRWFFKCQRYLISLFSKDASFVLNEY